MSFRRRGDIIGNPQQVSGVGVNRNSGAVPGAIPNAVPGRSFPNVHTQSRPTSISSRVPQSISSPVALTGKPKDTGANILNHPGVKPSILTSQPTVSTGSSELDKILGHQGLPLGCSMLIEENGTTDFATVLVKKFCSQGIVQNRLNNKDQNNTYLIVVGMDSSWGKNLPGLYKGSLKDQKKSKIVEAESKLSVSNLVNKPLPKRENDLKIAWRYGHLNKDDPEAIKIHNSSSAYPDYNHQFDITSSLIPAPHSNEIAYVPIQSKLTNVIKQIDTLVNKNNGKLIRLIVPSFLNPIIYPSTISNIEILKFIKNLKSLTRKYSNEIVITLTLNLDLYPRENPLTTLIEKFFDCIIELKPFDPKLYELIERSYSKNPKRIKQGFLNIYKIPILSDLGLNLIKEMEYCFKNGKRNFEIDEWSIPVDEETATDNNNNGENNKLHQQHSHSHSDIDIGSSSNPMQGQTKKNVEF
ncbi:hypothetical protein PACTADRAFT_82620 [Pachysolen tannophilus NRRL Y-2460]|uniref:Elongator complex protein 4 n=1 Tax=Pachysolen tannophilus NRRL Y-2460 TaxID=669874 RepID=A0A1E4TNG5_PACTA|nr:hypothetical protein PACTADRAFT_82620 [Pachysolen tannophilus NRRL Y-2460]